MSRPKPTRLSTVRLNRMLDDHQAALERDPQRLLDVSRRLVHMDERTLLDAEAQIRAGVYQRGPRKGQPYDERDRAVKEAWAERLRDALAENRARAAGAARRLGLSGPEPAA